jgi:hypothetical protein
VVYKTNEVESRKEYEPPVLTTISLRPEEAVLGHCKIFGQVGKPADGICGITCFDSGS